MPDVLLDKTKQGIAAFVRAVVGSRLDFLAMYPCNVVAQNGDGTLELRPDDSRLPGYSKVPIRLGVPGCTATIQSGSRVLVGWYAGDPSKPFAALFESSTVTQLNLTATTIVLNGGSTPVAKEGSATTGHLHTLAGTAGPYPVSGTAVLQVDTIAVGAGSQNVKVP